MRISSRTYPPPDHDCVHFGPRERTLAVLRYVLGLEPEVTNPKHPSFRPLAAEVAGEIRSIYELAHEARDTELGARIFRAALRYDPSAVVAPLVHEALAHSVRQEHLRRRGEPLEAPLLPTLRS